MTADRSEPRRRTRRGAVLPLLGALLLGAASWLPACSGERDVDEAIEELKDEAMDARDEIEDEVDDHT